MTVSIEIVDTARLKIRLTPSLLLGVCCWRARRIIRADTKHPAIEFEIFSKVVCRSSTNRIAISTTNHAPTRAEPRKQARCAAFAGDDRTRENQRSPFNKCTAELRQTGTSHCTAHAAVPPHPLTGNQTIILFVVIKKSRQINRSRKLHRSLPALRCPTAVPQTGTSIEYSPLFLTEQMCQGNPLSTTGA